MKVNVSKKGLNNGSEWYFKRFMEKGTFRPISGWKETQAYYKEHFGEKTYEEFAQDFKAKNWDPDEWMKLCKESGASYVVLTSKHHDGFCLWDTKSTDYNSVKTGCKQDLIDTFAKSARKHGLLFGVYYSWTEFGKGCTKEYIDKVISPQIDELKKYNPDIWWFDGDWMCTTKISNEFISNTVKKLKLDNPKIQINDRLGGSKEIKEKRLDPNYLGNATYRSYGDRELPKEAPKVPWEHINTIGYSWGRNKQQELKHYKTGEELFEIYEHVKELNGKFLLNLGPNSDGILDEIEVEKLQEFGVLYNEKKKGKREVEIVFESDDENDGV